MTFTEIFIAVALKGAIVTGLSYFNLWPDWEARARKREEHKRVLLAYEEWCERTGTRPAADPAVVDKLPTHLQGQVGAVKKRFRR